MTKAASAPVATQHFARFSDKFLTLPLGRAALARQSAALALIALTSPGTRAKNRAISNDRRLAGHS